MAVDPLDPSRMVVAWMQDPGRGGFVSATTSDGGATWNAKPVPDTSRCSGGSYHEGVDPWLSFGPDGALYLGVLRRLLTDQPTADVSGFYRGQIAVSRSADTGVTWGPFVGTRDDRPYDKEGVTAHPRKPGVVYLIWTWFQGAIGETGSATMFAKSSDAGETWTPEREVYHGGAAHDAGGPFGDAILVLPDDTLLYLFTEFTATEFTPDPIDEAVPIRAIRSTDDGETWSVVTLATRSSEGSAAMNAGGVPEPDGGRAIVRWQPSSALAPDGTVYAAWWDKLDAGWVLYLSSSRDGGASWSTPQVVLSQPEGPIGGPELTVGPDGTVAMLYMDWRNDKPGDGRADADWWFSHSHDGGTTWDEVHVVGPFDMHKARNKGEFDQLGEYHGLKPIPGGFALALAHSGPDTTGPQDVFFTKAILTSPPRPRLKLVVRPRVVRVGTRTRFRFRAYRHSGSTRRPLARARVRFAGRRARTNRRGRATIAATFRRRGRHRAVVKSKGLRASAFVRAR